MKYAILDTPGSTDADDFAAKIASSATSMAPIVFLVSRYDQMRSAGDCNVGSSRRSSIVLPIISAVNTELQSKCRDRSSIGNLAKQLLSRTNRALDTKHEAIGSQQRLVEADLCGRL